MARNYRRYTQTEEERFWCKVQKGDGCWTWTAHKSPLGYGRFLRTVDGRKAPWQAHRLALEWAKGPPPPGKPFALHSCDNPSCVRPDHLRWGDTRDNISDKIVRRRQTKGPEHSARMQRHAPRGERNWNARLTESQVRLIKRDPRPNTVICKEYGVSRCTVGEIKRGVAWRHVS